MFYLNYCGIVCASGSGLAAVRSTLFDTGQPAMRWTDAWSPGRQLPLGGIDPAIELPAMHNRPVQQQSRNNRLALAALAQIRSAVDDAVGRFGADRIGVVIGTSTSGIAETEAALRTMHSSDEGLPKSFHYEQQELGSVAQMLAAELGVTGPGYVHSSACSSSAKALASAARLIQHGLCDVVLCGGVDSLCRLTVAGFTSLDLVSSNVCNPFSANRDGINIGEGAALFLMSRERLTGGSCVALCGWGESSDGYHMSAPEPNGRGARLAITTALQRAGIGSGGSRPRQIDYINLHGTATVQNDQIEAQVVHDLFGSAVPVSSTKPFTGHALGAASALEAALCWLTMQDDNVDGLLPAHVWDGMRDPALPALNLVIPGYRLNRPVQWALSNSFAFGGSNAALVMGNMP